MARLLPEWEDEQTIYEIYTDSLNWLRQQIEQVNNRARFMTILYEDMLANSQPTFNALQTFFNVVTPFTEEYDVTTNTGNLRYGDSSKNIRTGKFTAPKHGKNCVVSDELLKKANEAHAAFVDFSKASSTTA